MNKILILIFLSGGIGGGLIFADPWENFRLGVENLNPQTKEVSHEYFAKAALEWEVMESSGISKYNAGTSWALAGDYRESVRNLRSYLRENPFSWEAKDNLERVRRDGALVDPGWDVNWKTLVLWIMGLTVIGALSIFLLRQGYLVIIGKNSKPKDWILFLSFLGVIGLGFIGLLSWVPDVRILGSSTSPRKGDGEFYEALGEPWKPGQELFVLDERSGWIRVKAGTREGWVPENILISY